MAGIAYLMVFLGGGIGAFLRFSLMGKVFPLTAALNFFPIGILLVNVIGSFLMGILVALLLKINTETNYAQSTLYLFLGIGVLGGLTTFSSFALDSVTLLQKGAMGQAVLYIVLSVGLSIGALFLGLWLMRSVSHGG